MTRLWKRIRAAWHRSGKQLEANAIENARLAHKSAERDKRVETELPPGRSNTDWTYIAPG
jgi:hypothetical protein